MCIQRKQKGGLRALDFYGNQRVKATLIVNLAAIEFDLLSKLEAKFSSWLKLRKAVALTLQLKQILLMQVRLKQYAKTKASVNMEMLQEASNAIIKLVQNKHFKDEVQKIRQKGLWERKVNYQP